MLLILNSISQHTSSLFYVETSISYQARSCGHIKKYLKAASPFSLTLDDFDHLG